MLMSPDPFSLGKGRRRETTMTVAKLFNLRGASPGSEVIHRGVQRFTHYQTLYQSLPELRSSERVRLVISRVASYFHEPKASANTAYE